MWMNTLSNRDLLLFDLYGWRINWKSNVRTRQLPFDNVCEYFGIVNEMNNVVEDE